MFVKKCLNCNSKHYLSFAVQNETRKFYVDIHKTEFLSFSNEIIIEKKILEKLTSDFVYMHASFIGYCNSYNNFFNVYYNNSRRIKLCIMRLIETWFYFHLLCLKNELHENNTEAFFIQNLDSNLSLINPRLREYFMKKWSGSAHRNLCRDEKCSELLVVDGNHKCTRLRCMFENVSFNVKELGKYICTFSLKYSKG